MLVYATPDDLAKWSGQPAPVNAPQLLRQASMRVREATELCFYVTDTTGLPSDATQLQAFNDATCCHAAALAALRVDPATGGVVTAGTATSEGLGSASTSFSDAQIAAAARAAGITSLVPDAQFILRDGGVTPTTAWIIG